MRVVLDTVVFVRSLIKPNNACGRAVFAHGEKFQLVVSEGVLIEILEVLQRPEITSKFSSKVLDFKKLLDFLSLAEVVEIDDISKVSRDIKDDKHSLRSSSDGHRTAGLKFLATAIAAHADYLVSEDEDLLVLKNYKGVRIVTCLEFANILEARGD